jgi:hypothetical protein
MVRVLPLREGGIRGVLQLKYLFKSLGITLVYECTVCFYVDDS